MPSEVSLLPMQCLTDDGRYVATARRMELETEVHQYRILASGMHGQGSILTILERSLNLCLCKCSRNRIKDTKTGEVKIYSYEVA